MKFRLLADPDRADVGFVDRRLQFHALQVLRDDEQDGRLERGCNGLAGIDAAGEHDAADRRIDDGVVQVRLLQLEVRPGDGERGLGALHGDPGAVARGAGGFEILARDGALRREPVRAGEGLIGLGKGGPGVGDLCFGGLDGGLGAVDLGRQLVRVESGEHVALPDRLVLLDIDGPDEPESWLETSTWVMGSRVPVAETSMVMSARAAVAVV